LKFLEIPENSQKLLKFQRKKMEMLNKFSIAAWEKISDKYKPLSNLSQFLLNNFQDKMWGI
jgi:hypothetical protein